MPGARRSAAVSLTEGFAMKVAYLIALLVALMVLSVPTWAQGVKRTPPILGPDGVYRHPEDVKPAMAKVNQHPMARTMETVERIFQRFILLPPFEALEI